MSDPWSPVFYDVAQALESTLDATRRVDRVLALVGQMVPSRRCALLEAAPIVVRRLSVVPEPSESERASLMQRLTDLLDRVASERPPPAFVSVADGRPELAVRHLAVPLVNLGEVRGILYVEPPADVRYEESHLGLLSAVAVEIGAYLAILKQHQEEQRALSEARPTAELLERVADAYLEVDDGLRCIILNASAEQLLGVARIDVLGERVSDLLRARCSDALLDSCARVLRERAPVHLASACARQLDRAYDVDIYPTERGLTIIMRDVTPRWRAQQLQELVVGIVAHDLRNPLGAMLAVIDLILRRGSLSASDSSHLQRAVRSGRRMTRLIDQLLDFTRIGRLGQLPIEPTPSNLGAICREAADELRASHPDSPIEVEVGDQLTGQWDADRLAEVISNLVGNAVVHGTPRTPIHVMAEQGEDDEVIVRISNQGPPIPPALQAVLFEPFARGPQQRGAQRGTGLGLFITRQIVRVHGGDVEVRSPDAGGTTFVVRLPRKCAPEDALSRSQRTS